MTTSTRIEDQSAVVIFDGVCNLCNWAVSFVGRRNPDAKFMWAQKEETM